MLVVLLVQASQGLVRMASQAAAGVMFGLTAACTIAVVTGVPAGHSSSVAAAPLDCTKTRIIAATSF